MSIVPYSPNCSHRLISSFRRYLPTRFEFYIKNCLKTMDSCCLFMRCHCRDKIAILNIFILHKQSLFSSVLLISVFVYGYLLARKTTMLLIFIAPFWGVHRFHLLFSIKLLLYYLYHLDEGCLVSRQFSIQFFLSNKDSYVWDTSHSSGI